MSMANQIYRLIDLTCLKETVTRLEVEELATVAQHHNMAAICVWPKHLAYIPKTCTLTKATVVNFPSGNQEINQVVSEINDINANFPGTEIDYVFNYQAFLRGDSHQAIQECQQICALCHSLGLKIKVIVETGAFANLEQLAQAVEAIISCGADMLKTSTGKITTGATFAAVEVFCQAILKKNLPCGIKVSGGISSMRQAAQYLQLIAKHLPHMHDIRFGCSQMVNDL